MENDQAFEAEADIEALERVDSRLRQRSSHKGHDTLKAALGGFESEAERNDEHSPLLPRVAGEDHDSDRTLGNDEEGRRGSPTWEGERDFEGRPWWNKPSVWILLLPGSIKILILIDLLASSSFRLVHTGLRWHGRTASQSHTLSRLPRILLRTLHPRPQLPHDACYTG